MRTKTIKGFYLEYVTVKNIPLVKTGQSFGISSQVWGAIEKAVAREVLTRKIPLRGKEVKFIRKSFGLSARALAEMLGVSHVAVLKWEKDESKRLDKFTEIAVRALLADYMHIEMLLKDAILKGIDQPSKIEVDATRCA